MLFLFCVVVFRFDSNQLALMGRVTVKGSLRFGVPVTWLGWEEGMFSQSRKFQKRPLPRPRQVWAFPATHTSCPEHWGMEGTRSSRTAKHDLNLFLKQGSNPTRHSSYLKSWASSLR